MTPKQERYIAIYIDEVSRLYPWAQDEAKLAKARNTIAQAIADKRNEWQIDGQAGLAAWRALGGKGKPTFKAIHSL